MGWTSKPPFGTPLKTGTWHTQDLVAYWSFQEGGGTTLNDVYNSNNGTLYNFAIPPTSTSGWNMESFGSVLAFDGTDDFVDIPHSSSLNFSGNITIAVWVYPKVSNVYQTLVCKSTAQEVRQYALYLSSLGVSRVFVALGGTNLGNLTVSPNWTVDAWNHIVMTANGSQVKIYINSTLANTTSSSLVATTGTANVSMGKDLPYNSFRLNGRLEGVMIWNRALSGSEIAELYSERWCIFQDPIFSIKSVSSVPLANIKSVAGVSIGNIKTIR